MEWNELDRNTPGQLIIPECLKTFSLAEKVFIELGSSWFECAESVPKTHPLPRQAEIYALACLLLAEEWGKSFCEVSRRRIETNRDYAAERRGGSWYEALPWRLCLDNSLDDNMKTDALDELLANLDHHNSALREWMMEIAWFVFSRLNRTITLVKLYKNIAGTLGGVEMAIGLATRYFKDNEEFNLDASNFIPEKDFTSQYFDRIKAVGKIGILCFQAGYLDLEVKCRKTIEKEILGELVSSIK